MSRMPSASRNSRFSIPVPVLLVFIAAALAALIIAMVNVRSSSVRADAVQAIERMTSAMRQLNEFQVAVKDAEIQCVVDFHAKLTRHFHLKLTHPLT